MDDSLRELQEVFFGEADQILEDLESSLMKLEGAGFEEELVNKIFRLAHNFKGSSRSVGFTNLADLAHKAEDLLTKLKSQELAVTAEITTALLQTTDALRSGLNQLKQDRGATFDHASLIQTLVGLLGDKASSHQASANEFAAGFGFFDDAPRVTQSPVATSSNEKPKESSKVPLKIVPNKPAEEEQLRISAKKTDLLLNLVGELVVNQTILQELNNRGESGTPRAQQTITYISKIVSDVQSVSMSLRLTSVKPLFQKLRRAVRDVASELAKEIDYVDEGDHVELDKTVIDRMVDPLTHMVRNAVDHGIENAEERVAAGKPPLAKVVLSAVANDDRVIISLSDDGKGLNKAKIVSKALERGLITETEASHLTPHEIHSLIFRSGFSTKEAVSAISGRGVGMEVVQKAVDEMKGTIQIESEEGKGTTFRISLPLSLSIIGGMVVRLQRQNYVVPISQLLETIELSKLSIETSTAKGQMVKLRNEVLPIYNLSSALMMKRPTVKANQIKRPALVTICDGKKVSFEVDEIVGQQQVVLKKLGRELVGLPGLMGGAILSSSDPGLVLNLHELIKKGNIHAGQ